MSAEEAKPQAAAAIREIVGALPPLGVIARESGLSGTPCCCLWTQSLGHRVPDAPLSRGM